MPTLETPPNPAPVSPPPAPQKIVAGRHGELDHSELVRLLDTLDDDRSRSRFRESIYISLLFYVVLGWFVLYGPRLLWHTPQVVPISQKEDKHEMTYLDTPADLAKVLPKTPSRPRTPPPTPEQKVIEQPAPRRAEPPPAPKAAAPAPKPAASPAPAPPPIAKATPAPPTPTPPPAPTPRPKQPTQSVPDAPKPSSVQRPNFGTPQSAGDQIAQAARDAANAHSSASEEEGTGATAKRPGMGTGAEILSDTMGVDFGPYIKRLLQMVRASWIPLIPEETRPPLSKEGTTLIRFTIQKDGTLSYMHLDDSTHDDAINRAAWGGIKGVGQYPPLPADFKGAQLDLRIQFVIKQYRRGAE